MSSADRRHRPYSVVVSAAQSLEDRDLPGALGREDEEIGGFIPYEDEEDRERALWGAR